jgi:hypothetical protein
MPLTAHLQFLRAQMGLVRHVPTLFEYHAAMHMTRIHGVRFYVYQDVPESHKVGAGFPATDKGVDLISETYDHIAQVKYYRPGRAIHYGRLSTFLATPLLVGRPHLRLTLLRTTHCQLHREIQAMVERGDLRDVTLCQRAFLRAIHR